MTDYSPLLGEPAPETEPGVLEAAFHAVLNRFREKAFLSAYDEETITAALLGGLSIALPFCAVFFGGNEGGQRLCWGHFSKSGGQNGLPTEAKSGADFALVVYAPGGWAHLAVFQAKKVRPDDGPSSLKRQRDQDAEGTLHYVARNSVALKGVVPVTVQKEQWFMDVHRRPDPPKPPAEWRKAQLVVLSAFAESVENMVSKRIAGILERIDRRRDVLSEEPQSSLLSTKRDLDERQKQWISLGKLRVRALGYQRKRNSCAAAWCHYLGYVSDCVDNCAIEEVVCVPVCELEKELWRELDRDRQPFSHNWVDLSSVNCYRFTDVVRSGVKKDRAGKITGQGWFKVDRRTLDKMLPLLMELATVYVADDRGGSKGLCPELRNALVKLSVDKIGALELPTRRASTGPA